MIEKIYLSEKRTVSGNNRSKALNSTKRVWKPNKQKKTVMIDVNGKIVDKNNISDEKKYKKVVLIGSIKEIKSFEKKNKK